MSTLVLLLPERTGTVAPADGPLDWLLLNEAGEPESEGSDLPEQLPAADALVLLLPEQACSWHRVTLPRGSRKRWRQALVGLLEEQLLDDPEQLLLALDAQALPGEPAWVAATPRAPLAQLLARLERAQRLVDRIVPRGAPQLGEAAEGHFFLGAGGPQLRWADAQGLATLPLAGGFARARFSPSRVQAARWSASAEAQAPAEAWLGMRVALAAPAEQARRALAGDWDLRQFELAPRLHGLRWLRQLGHQLMQRQWQAARQGLLALGVIGLLGLNLLAWQQRSQLAERQQQLEATLKTAFPRVAYVLEPQLQMQRELAQARVQAGELGDQDLETLVAALAAAWPETRGPLDALSYENGQLSWPRAGWSDDQLQALRRQLASEGWQLGEDANRLTLKRNPA